MVGSSRLDWATAIFLFLEEFKNELLQLARTKLGGDYVGSVSVDPNVSSKYLEALLRTLAASRSK